MAEPSRVLDLRDYWRMVRARFWVVAIGAVIVGALTTAYVTLRPPVYVSRAKVLVEPLVDVAVADLSGSTAGELAPDMLTEAEVVKSFDIAQEVVAEMGLEITPEELLNAISVDVVRDTTVMYVGARHQRAAIAAAYANAIAEQYLDQRRELVRERVAPAIASLEERLGSLQSDAGDTSAALEEADDPLLKGQLNGELQAIQAQIAAVGSRLGDMQTVAAVSQGGRIVQEAPEPPQPVGPNLAAAAILGMMFGAVLGAVAAIILGVRANRVADRNELAGLLGAQVMGLVPRIDEWSRRETAELITRKDPEAPASEAYRTLSTNIRFLRSQQPVQVIVVTSALPSEGKSTTAANLAVILAESGTKTLLVDADLRRPRVERFLGIPFGPGLSDSLGGGGGPLDDLVHQTEVENLSLLRAGAVPTDPVSLLAGPRSGAVFAEMRRLSDIVICDTPPILPVADASIVAEHADGVMFVHDANISSRAAIEDAVQQLNNAGAAIIGGVYNNMTAVQRSSLGYASYDSYYGEEKPSKTDRSRTEKAVQVRTEVKREPSRARS